MSASRSLRSAAAGAAGACAVAGALLFGAGPAQAAPVPGSDTSFTTTGPHGAPGGPGILPDRPGGGHGGHGWGGHGWGWGGHPGWGSGNRGFWAPGHWWNWWW
ncbi:MAG: hypothetical protein ACXVX1_04430 [Mycobacterium sp.]